MADRIDPSGLHRMLSETLNALSAPGATGAAGAAFGAAGAAGAAFGAAGAAFGDRGPGTAGDPEPVEGVGHGADGLIEVRVGPPGRVTGLDLRPEALRLGPDRLAAELTVAIDAALAGLRERLADGAPDLGALAGQLRDVQQETGRQLTAFTDSLFAAQQMLIRRADGER
ncbi:hypothetical protein J2S43_002857 [Catenuloplanes nepalensis]|uniref:Uncharacterized protein n=1 Tax=Catenuloplanes nepalensis TaxID=587533 RepID=A0ABT9MSC9_9ACTN|nr:YbaB/EbfC family DNA-binding protein [Catenuloplanes nepalensis]MDP9794345.1 hypothetical protein [Catenuloplanes nepalensis]